MIQLSSLFQTFQKVGALSSKVAPTAFLSDQIFVCKGGEFGMVLKTRGSDAECLTAEDMEARTEEFRRGIALFDERFHINQYLFRNRDVQIVRKDAYPHPLTESKIARRLAHLESKRLHEVEGYLVVLFDPKAGRFNVFSNPFAATAKTLSLVESEAIQAMELLRSKVESFRALVKRTLSTEVLGKEQAFLFFQKFLNLDKRPVATLKSDSHIDYYVSNTEVSFCRKPDGMPTGHLSVGDQYVRVFAMKDTPMKSFAHLFSALERIEGNLIVSNTWMPMAPERALKDLKQLRRFHHAARTSWSSTMRAAALSDNRNLEQPGDVLIEGTAEEHLKEIERIKKEIVNRARPMGLFSFTVVAYDSDLRRLERVSSEITRVFASKEAVLIEERFNAMEQFCSVMPGNHRLNLRQLKILNTNHADMSFVFGTDQGNVRNESLRDEYLSVFETNQATPYYLNLHQGGVLGGFLVGKTGAGKSTLMNGLIADSQKYNPYTFIFDIGNSYRELTRQYQGAYFELSLDNNQCKLNPFSLPNTADNREFLYYFAQALMGGPSLTHDDEKALHSAIAYVMGQTNAKLRTVGGLAHAAPASLAPYFSKWTGKGPYAQIFCQDDDLSTNAFQTFELGGIEKHAELVGPVLMYLLYRVQGIVQDPARLGTSKWIWIDEAWRFLDHPVLAGWIKEAVKTFRKHNSGCVFATQGAVDFQQGDLVETIRESCEMKLFLYNPSLNAKVYKGLFDLNDHEIALIRTLEDKKQFLFKNPRTSVVLNYTLDAETLLEYSNSPFENLERELVRTASQSVQ